LRLLRVVVQISAVASPHRDFAAVFLTDLMVHNFHF
jgi:hypothetical protein